ncbi:MAG TPA: GNAT family N-acetyltransferase [Cyclobacteriaceae bacterium]
MKLLPIQEKLEDNPEFISNPACVESLQQTITYFQSIGYSPPWIGYYASVNNKIMGGCAFKGRPVNGRVEIAYGTFPEFQHQGIGAEMCCQLVELALQTDPSVIITARTLMEENFSTKILKKNNFILNGIVIDTDDGEVWEWEYKIHYFRGTF